MSTPPFRTEFSPQHGNSVPVAPDIVRVTAPNSGPFTFHGTNSYIVGDKSLVVIDPGPDDSTHLKTLLEAINGRPVSHIAVTHTHMDHSPLSRQLAKITGAEIVAEGPHRAARDLHIGEQNPLDAAADRDFEPDISLGDGDLVHGDGWTLEAIHTPGHTANHVAFALRDRDILFPGDHVMGWSTSIVAPPDGSMSDYMNSLDILAGRDEGTYFPGHGGRLEKGREFTRALRTHRKMRESAILARIRGGDRRIREIVAAIYKDTNPKLHGAAALSVMAHLEDLVASGKVTTDGPVSIDGEYFPATD